MDRESNSAIRRIERKMHMIGVYDFPGTVALGLSLYARFGAQGEPFHPLLANALVVDGLLAFGLLTVLCSAIYFFKLLNEKKRLEKIQSTRGQ